jgi:hypothetical protein
MPGFAFLLVSLVACGNTTIGTDDTSSGGDDSSADTDGGGSVDIVAYDGPALLINEVMADGNADATTSAQTGDWVEILNSTGSAVSLDGYGLDVKTAMAMDDVWPFPADTSLAAGGYLYVSCAHGIVGDNGLDSPIKLEFDGDRVALYQIDSAASTLALVDEASWTDAIELPNSYARTPDGALSWALDPTPTPGAANH